MDLLIEIVKGAAYFLCGVGATTVYHSVRGFRLVAKR